MYLFRISNGVFAIVIVFLRGYLQSSETVVVAVVYNMPALFLENLGIGVFLLVVESNTYFSVTLIYFVAGSRKSRLTAVGIRCADHATPSIRKSWH
jgi:hypothetical protein